MQNTVLKHTDDDLPPQIRALLETESYLASPSSIGLDSFKESLRNVIQLMLELKGYSTGYDLSHLVIGEHSSMAMHGVLKDDNLKKRKAQQFWEDFLKLEKEMMQNFHSIFQNMHEFIITIEENIDNKIEKIDTQIEAAAQSDEHAVQLKQNNKERRRLKAFKRHIENHKQDLEEAESTEDLIDIGQNLAEDLEDLNNGKPVNTGPRVSGMSVIAGVRDVVLSTCEPNQGPYGDRSRFNQSSAPDLHDPFYDFVTDLDTEGYSSTPDLYNNTHQGKTDSGTGDRDSSGDNGDGKQDSGVTRPDFDL